MKQTSCRFGRFVGEWFRLTSTGEEIGSGQASALLNNNRGLR